MKNNFQSKAVPKGTRTIWRYLSALFLLFTFAIGNVWAEETILATFRITLSAAPTDKYASYSDDDATYTCNKVGSNSSSNYALVGSQYYMKLTAKDAYVKIKLKSGSIAAGDKVYVYHNHTSNKNGVGFAMTQEGTNGATGNATANTELKLSYTLTASDIAADGSISVYRQGSNLYVGRIEVAHPEPECDKPGTPADLVVDSKTYNSATFSWSAAANSDGYKVYVEKKSDKSKILDWTTCATTSYTATGLAAETEYTFKVKAIGASGYCELGDEATVDVTTEAAPSACPEGLSISGTKDYTEGETISLTAALEAGNGEITYTWYKGSIAAGNEVGTGASFSKASCATSDAGNYYCVASKDACSDAESTAYAVTVAAAIDPWIIKVALSGDISSATKTMSGSIGGDAAYSGLQNSSAPYKIGSNSAYLNLTLSTGYFYPGDSVVLDLSKTGQIFYGATDNDNDHLLGTTTAKDGIHYFILPASFPANTNSIHVGRTSSTYNGTLSYMAVYRTPICPQTLTISGETDYVPGEKIELTASLAKGNGAITYQWYKGGTANENKLTGKTNAKLEIEDCVAGDAGDYYCIASKEDCSDAVNAAAYSITVNDFVAVTGITISPASPTVAAKSKITLTAEVAPVEATNKVVEWSVKSGSEAYASVNATTGEVTGKAAGNAVIVATATDGSGVFAEKTVAVTPFVCPTSGTIYSFVSDGTKAPGSNTYCPASGVQGVVDIATYATVSGGLAQGVHTTTSNNPIQIQTSTSAVKLSHADGYFRALLECPLQEGDTIKFEKTNKVKMAFDSLRTKVVEIASGTGANKDYYIVPATYAGEDTIMVYYGGSSVNLTALRVIRPEKFAVTFNMHGHGTQVEPQNIISGGKVTEPATTDITGWDFGGWYKTYVAEPESYSDAWDFANDVVSAATELHAKWTAHVASNDVTLGTLSVNGEAITIVPSQTVYAVELPMGTSDIPTVVATANDVNAKACIVTQATAVDGSASIYIKAEDDATEATYTINFSVATSKDIELVWDKSKQRCDATTPAAVVKSDDATVSTYINKMTFTGGGEGSSLNVGNTAGNMVTLTAKPGYAISAMSFFGKIEADDAKLEYSLDGGAWTDLASTNAGDACYAAVFTAAEVHELRMRSAGNKGFWIRNMQLTMIEACTPIVVAWDEEPVEFEVGKAGYAIAATANNGGIITYASADNTVIDVNASTGALTIAGLGSVALSASTPEGDGTTYCANGGDPIVLSKVVNTYYLVKFDGQNGEAADEVKYFSGDAAIALPAAPIYSGFDFQGWFDAETGGNKYTEAIAPTASITVYAQWVAQCAGATITTQPVGASYLTGRTPADLVCEATAGAGGALTYEWFTCDDEYKANPVAATATPSTAAAGTFYYFCKVTEDGCGVEAFSDVVTITVTDKTPICLIATTVTGATAHGAVTGFLGEDRGGDAEVNVSGGSYKMDKGKYIGVTLPDGYKFQEGDKVVLNVMTVNNATGFTLFDGKDGEKNLIIDTRDGALVPAGANTVVLPAYAGSQSVYVLREDNSTTGNLNSAIDAIAVYRTCAPILNKVTVNGAEGKPNALKEVVFEVAASTTQSQLEAIAFDWVSNDDAWTAANAPVAANAWEFGVANEVTFTDKDGDQSVYTITVNKAAASTNVELATLTVDGNAITVVPGQDVYEYEYPYGTAETPAPVVAATTADANATLGTISQAATKNGTATFTVTAEDGTTYRDYTVNFSVSRVPTYVIFDGSVEDDYHVSGTGVSTFAWEVVGGKTSSYKKGIDITLNGKHYENSVNIFGSATNSSTRYVEITIPDGYLAKFYLAGATNNGGEVRSSFISKEKTGTLDESIAYASTDSYDGMAMKSDFQFPGTYYMCCDASIRLYELSVQLYPIDVTRDVTEGRFGTICYPNGGYLVGAMLLEIAYFDPDQKKIFFDEVIGGKMIAGAPYLFLPNEGVDKFAITYTDNLNAEAGHHNGLYGSYTQEALPTDGNHYIMLNNQYCKVVAANTYVGANRAYILLDKIGNDYVAPAYGRRRVSMSVNTKDEAQGFENLQSGDQPMKVMIDGTLYIIRGEKVFDATGRLVK